MYSWCIQWRTDHLRLQYCLHFLRGYIIITFSSFTMFIAVRNFWLFFFIFGLTWLWAMPSNGLLKIHANIKDKWKFVVTDGYVIWHGHIYFCTWRGHKCAFSLLISSRIGFFSLQGSHHNCFDPDVQQRLSLLLIFEMPRQNGRHYSRKLEIAARGWAHCAVSRFIISMNQPQWDNSFS